MSLKKILCFPHVVVMKLQALDFLGPLAIRLYLIPVFWMAGYEKITNIDAITQWFGEGLGLPLPMLMAYLASLTELAGAVLLTLGLATRYISVPLMITMLVAIFAVHWDQGWSAIASHDQQSVERLSNLLSWIKEHYPMRYQYATELGKPVILNNGIEFAVTYFIMLLSLFFTGGGRYLSVDYWIARKFGCPYKHHDSSITPQ